MTRPLHKGATRHPEKRPPDAHAGLWFDKFCNKWSVCNSSWAMGSPKGDGADSPKLEWINSVTSGRVGTEDQIGEFASRMARLVERSAGRFSVLTSESRFVTGLGRSHPVENGFAWHPTLGTPYLPGSSIKGAVRAWAKLESNSPIPHETTRCLFGDPESTGRICFLDAVPTAPVQLEADVMTPHYAGWTECNPPGDWRSPKPIPFLVTAAGTSLLFGIIPCGAVSDDDLDAVMSSLCSALAWSGGGAKTAVGYGRFGRDDPRTDDLRQRLRNREREREARIRAEQAAAEREARRAAMDPIDREIEELLEERANQGEPDVVTIIRMVNEGRWGAGERARVARWLERRMRSGKQWKEASAAKNPRKDKAHQRTLLVKGWLDGGRE